MNYITIANPKQVNSKRVEKEVRTLIESGVKSGEISLIMEFVSTDEVVKQISNSFRRLKNMIAFEVRPII